MTEYEVYDMFLDFEEEENFFDIKYKDIPIYDYTRYFYYKVMCCEFLNIDNFWKPPINPTDVQTNEYIQSHLIDIDKLKHYDMLLMGDSRRIKQTDGLFHDIYIDYLPDKLTNYSHISIEDPFWTQFPHNPNSHLTPAYTDDLVYTDNIVHSYYNAYFDDNQMSEDKAELTKIFQEITKKYTERFQLDFEIATIKSVGHILYLLFTEPYFLQILDKVSPKIIFFIFHPNPGALSLLRCAKLRNIPIVEIQHGIFGEFEPIWHKFRNTSRPHQLPDYVFALSPRIVIEDDMVLTTQNNRIKYVGYPLLERKVKEYENVPKPDSKKKYILFVSQSNIGQSLAMYASNLADLLKDNDEYHIIYKLHPYELYKDYPCLKKDNITVINNLEKDIYYFANMCDIQVGVYSTAIYEAIPFGTTTIIAKGIMGSDEALRLLDGIDGVYSAPTAFDAYNVIMHNPSKPKGEDFWPRVTNDTINTFVEEIINNN